MQFLFDYTTGATDPSSVLILAVSAAMILVGVLLATQLPGGRLLALLGAALAIATAAYGFQVHQASERSISGGRSASPTSPERHRVSCSSVGSSRYGVTCCPRPPWSARP